MNIQNYFKYNEQLSSGAQPTAEQLAALKAEGFHSIVNISPVSAKNALKEEAQLVEQLKMDYIHFPVDCSNLQALHYEVFRGIMKGLQHKKVFVHCGGNIKSSNLLYMYQVLEQGVKNEEAMQTLLKIQKPEEKWFVYFEKMGIKRLQLQSVQ